MQDSIIDLPKKDKDGLSYISYSQYTTWKKSKREYIRQHFYGEPFVSNDFIRFGSKVGEALEKNNFSEFTEKEREFLSTIPRYDDFERKLTLQMDGYYVIGYADSCKNIHPVSEEPSKRLVSHILDYKTGDVVKKAKKYESDDYTQLHLYCASLYQETGHLPTDVRVILIDRKGNAFKGEKLTLGGTYREIYKDVSHESIREVLDDLDRVVKEISDCYKVFKKLKLIEQ